MQKEEIEAELYKLRKLLETIRDDQDRQKTEPTLKEFALWLSSNPDWGEDAITAGTANSLDTIICAFLCQNL